MSTIFPARARASNLVNSVRSGFTLVEVLGVVAIIAVLTAIVLTVIANAQDAAKRARAERNVAILNEAMESYMAGGGVFTAAADMQSLERVNVIVNSLRSTHPSALSIGGPFLAGYMLPEIAAVGWRAVAKSREIEGRQQLYFDVTKEEGEMGITGFGSGPLPNGFEPIGISAGVSSSASNLMGSPTLSVSHGAGTGYNNEQEAYSDKGSYY